MSNSQHIFCLFVFDRKTFLPRPCLEKSFMIISCLTFPKSSTCACFLEKATVSCCTRWLVSCLTRFTQRETGGLKPTCAPLKLVLYAWSQYFMCAACLPGPFDCLQAIKVPLNYIPGKLLRKIQASLMCSDIHHWLGILTKYVLNHLDFSNIISAKAFVFYCGLSVTVLLFCPNSFRSWKLTLSMFSFREHIYSAAVILQWPGWDGAHCVAGNYLIFTRK